MLLTDYKQQNNVLIHMIWSKELWDKRFGIQYII